MSSQFRSYANYNAHQRPTVGDTKTSAVNYDHIGWLKCDGRQISKIEFSRLYTVIGDTFGTADDGYFRLPNAAGRVIGNVGNANVDGRTWYAGDISGEETHILTLPEIPSHNHTKSGATTGGVDGITDVSGNHNHTYQDAYFAENLGGSGPRVKGTSASTDVDNDFFYRTTTGSYAPNPLDPTADINLPTSTAGAHAHHIASNGGDQPHNNMQPTLFLGNLFIFCGKPRVGSGPNYNAFPPDFSKLIY